LNERGYVRVNERLETSAPSVWALGECAGSPQFTHISEDDFRIVRDNLGGGKRSTHDRLVPYCMFTEPPLAHVGLSERDAERQNVKARVAKLPMSGVLRAQAIMEMQGFMKVLVDEADEDFLEGALRGLQVLEVDAARVEVVEEPAQKGFDPRFPTVKSPNPENAEALTLAVALAEKEKIDVVMATDPDCDRMGAAVRNAAGTMELLTGNQVGALLADYRVGKYKELGWIPQAGTQSACIIKTFVTTPLQEAIGRGHGVKVIDTLTGFKWIAAKMRGYEEKLTASMGHGFNYDKTPFRERAKLLQQHSCFYLFGTEESYGYLPNDSVRDKDGSSACLMFAELCAWVKSRGKTVPEYLDEIYLRYGFYLEGVINIYYEGATGAAKIKRILETYRANPPTAFGETKVTRFQDFGRERFFDADNEQIPAQDLYLVTLSNGYSFAARGSGTEPKMKFYLFASEPVASAADLPAAKAKTKATLDALKALIEADARKRADPPSP